MLSQSEYPLLSRWRLEMNNTTKRIIWAIAALAAVSYLVMLVLAYSTPFLSEDLRTLFQDYLYLVSVTISVVLGALATSRYGLKKKFGVTLLLIFLGYACYFLFEIYWVFLYSKGLETIEPYTVGLIILANLLFLVGMFFGQREGEIEWDSLRLSLSLLFMLGISLLTFYLSVTYFYIPESSPIDNLYRIVYGVLDTFSVISIIMLLNLSISQKDRDFTKLWLIFAMCFIFMWVGDTFYTIWHVMYDEGVWAFRQLDYIWIMGYLMAAYGFYLVLRYQADPTVNKGEK
jgi:hypothetical protein